MVGTIRDSVVQLKGQVFGAESTLGNENLTSKGMKVCVEMSNQMLDQIKEEVEKEFLIFPIPESETSLLLPKRGNNE